MASVIRYYVEEPFTPAAIEVLKRAREIVYGDVIVQMEQVPQPGFGVLSFGPDAQGGVRTLYPWEIATYPNAEYFVAFAMYRDLHDGALPDVGLSKKVLFLDLETHNAGKQYDMPADEFFRLGQYAWGLDGNIVLTTSREQVIEQVRQAAVTIAFNGHSFDFSVLFGPESVEALELARDGKLFDPMIHAALNLPAAYCYRRAKGKRVTKMLNGDTPKGMLAWLSLQNLSYHFGLEGKFGDLDELAMKYQPEGTKKEDIDYSLIPLDDPDFLAYARQDIVALRELVVALLWCKRPDLYDDREQICAAIDAQTSRNGLTLDIPLATERAEEAAEKKQLLMTQLEIEYGFPTEGKKPWTSKKGKDAIFAILKDHGIVPEEIPGWPRTDTGNISLGGEALINGTEGTEAASLGRTLAELSGQRSLAQLALDHVSADGKVHPKITMFQRSGRKSVTDPGLTTWGREKPEDKEYFIADEGCLMVEMDYSAADARIAAAYSGDEEYAKRFEPGFDPHEISGRLAYGDEEYDANPDLHRQESKPLTHGWTYGGQAATLSEKSGVPLENTKRFIAGMESLYSRLMAWQKKVRAEAATGWITNAWGRRMPVSEGRHFTQGPALMGQSGTTEVLKDALLRMLAADIRYIQWMRLVIHDAMLFCIPQSEIDEHLPKIKALMETTWGPNDGYGMDVHFPAGVGVPAKTWMEGSH